MPAPSPDSPEHLSTHLPRMKGCPVCDEAKHVHKYKLRRKRPMIQVLGQDAVDDPFGALVHIDWVEIKRGTRAAAIAARALVVTDDVTQFRGVFRPTTKRMRRWWNSSTGSTTCRAIYAGCGATGRPSSWRRPR